MAIELEKLVVTLDADLRKYQSAMAKAQGITTTRLRQIEREFEASQRRVSNTFGNIGSFLKGGLVGAVAGIASAQGVRQIREIVGAVADIGDQADRLGLTTDEFQRLALVAKLGGVDVDSFAQAMKKLGVNSSDAARGQGELGAILQANGVKITDANGKLLSQAQVLPIIADLIKNAATEQDKLAIAQAAFGKSGSEMLTALQGGAEGVRKAFADAAATKPIDEETIRKAQELDDAFDKLATTISNSLKSAIINTFSIGGKVIDYATDRAYDFVDAIQTAQKFLGVIDEIPQRANVQQKGDANAEFLKTHDLQGKKIGVVRPKGESPTQIPGGGTGGGGNGTGSSPTIERVNEHQQETEAIQKQIDALQLQAQQFGKTAEEAARLEASHRLLNAAQEAGVKITPELKAQIEALAGQYSSAVSALDNLAEQQQAIDDINGSLRSSLTGFADDLRNGVDAADALQNALDDLIGKLTDLALNNVLDQLLGTGAGGSNPGGGFGGILSTFLGGIFGGFRASGGSVQAGKAYLVGEKRPELFVPGASGTIVPGLPKAGGGGYGKVTINNFGAAVESQERDAGGEKELVLTVKNIVRREISDPYSPSSGVLTARGAKMPPRKR